MSPVSKADFFSEKNTVFLSHSGHKTVAAFDESGDGVFLTLFFS